MHSRVVRVQPLRAIEKRVEQATKPTRSAAPALGLIYRHSVYHDAPPAVLSSDQKQQHQQPAQAETTTTVATAVASAAAVDASYEEIETSGALRRRSIMPSDALARVPGVQHGLERVIEQRGVHFLRDPLTRRFNFTPWLHRVHQPHELHVARLSAFTTTSQDERTLALAAEHGARFVGSTSSVGGLLAHLYFALSAHRPINTSMLTSTFSTCTRALTPALTKPVSIMLRRRGDVTAVDSNPGNRVPTNRILLDLGKTLERMLTLDEATFSKLLLKRDGDDDSVDDDWRAEAAHAFHDVYNYQLIGDMLLRAQLDCRSAALPGNGTYDLKTRATAAIRCDMANYRRQAAYRLERLTGQTHSFEREFYDMARSVLLKYLFQVRIGDMQGVLCAYHNTAELFGFEYVSRQEMEQVVFGSSEYAEHVFAACNALLQRVLAHATARVAGDTLRVVLSAAPSPAATVDVFVEAVADDAGWMEASAADKGASAADDDAAARMPWFESTMKPVAADFAAYARAPVYHFRLQLRVTHNGRAVDRANDYAPGDTLRIRARIEPVARVERSSTYEPYLEALRLSEVYEPARL